MVPIPATLAQSRKVRRPSPCYVFKGLPDEFEDQFRAPEVESYTVVRNVGELIFLSTVLPLYPHAATIGSGTPFGSNETI
ncbi:unnamed protein product [Onchocerca ochengi]|uniref:Uncharacterized protein n=1 Tax=Onchocerca ochengi TaxID=42157 RepID=A0A182E2I1_ONCOC|nr:unnamed protein product [Onchocerca ochengi]